MVHMDPQYERLLKLAAEAREARGLQRQADLIKAARLSRSTVHRFESGEVVSETALRKISQAIGWTPTSAQDVLAGGEPITASAESVPRIRDDEYELEVDPEVGTIVHNTVYEVIGVMEPDMPLSRFREIEAIALEAVLRRGGKPRKRHPQAFDESSVSSDETG